MATIDTKKVTLRQIGGNNTPAPTLYSIYYRGPKSDFISTDAIHEWTSLPTVQIMAGDQALLGFDLGKDHADEQLRVIFKYDQDQTLQIYLRIFDIATNLWLV